MLVGAENAPRDLECDIAVIGGSFGGVPAALAACDAGLRVVMSEATDWLGGQVTSQGVAPLDEHAHIETFGGTRAYNAFRARVRDYYVTHHGAPPMMPDGAPLNPGNGWVSRLCFEPRVGLKVLYEMLLPHLRAGQLTVLLEHEPVSTVVENDIVKRVVLRSRRGGRVRVQASYVLDATDLGDLLPLTGTAYVTGAESQDDTGEPHARLGPAAPGEVQSFTYSFALSYHPGEDHTIARPEGYARFRDLQPYALHLNRGKKRFRMFERGPGGELPFWSYRRIYDAKLLRGEPSDLVLVNWAGNDYRSQNLIDKPPAEAAHIHGEAKRLALGFLYWLQTECPRDEGGHGYPELCLRPDVLGSYDGLAKAPYIRESRRLRALERVLETDLVAGEGRGARARPMPSSVGVGWYPIDLHACVGNDEVSLFEPTLPFQIPLGALIPRSTKNLLAACKNIGTTHLTNGAYRLQPVEWNVGEAAGTLAAFCLESGRSPQGVHASAPLTHGLQRRLLARGVPLAWTVDVPPEHPLFTPVQRLYVAGAIPLGSPRFGRLEVGLDEPLHPSEGAALLELLHPRHHEMLARGEATWRGLCAALAPDDLTGSG
jgi:hypothetical protein